MYNLTFVLLIYLLFHVSKYYGEFSIN